MGCQNAVSYDRARTYWTPVMERYFIDLMLEQMHKGNRSGHTFNKQAWADMLMVFNANFGTQYDKDVLKNRYTNLWKQFNDVKNLLSHGGFSWDETREMVIAEEYVWDAYIKAHPDARSYKTKAVLNFNDLCLIYGYTTADGRYSRSSHDLDIEDELHGVNIGEGISSLVPLTNDQGRTDWTLDMDQYFVELMLDQVRRGNKTANTFSKQAWTYMLSMFNAKFGPQHGKRVLRHRYKKLWKYYCDIANLLQHNGFSWDDEQHMVVADDDAWDAYIKVHAYARAYRMKSFPNYYDLLLIYGNHIEDGNNVQLHLERNLGGDVSDVKNSEENGNQTPTVTDRTRTYWTPPMDRYFIDLLLEQVHKGNKLGQTFISQAWIDMVSAFNGQFRSHHDKDVLKNRYKYLRRLYNDIKVILQQRGFSWDETREIVTADDLIWDAYVKEHPDARPYRVKTVPSYHKLCTIFGEESSDRRYSRLACAANNEFPVLMTDELMHEQTLSGGVPSAIDWTMPMDQYFVALMLEQFHEGNMIDQMFNDQVWAHMVASFNDKFQTQCDKYILEDRYMKMMRQYDDISTLLCHSGFVWDETQKMLIAENDVWEAYAKEHPDAVSYRDKVVGYYNDLCKIFGNMEGTFTYEDLESVNDKSLEMNIDETLADMKTADDVQISQQRKRKSELSSEKGPFRKVLKADKDMQRALSEMADVVSKLVDKSKPSCYKSVEGAIDELRAMPDIDEELMLDACDLLEDERSAKTFLALDVTLRKKWLLRKLRPH